MTTVDYIIPVFTVYILRKNRNTEIKSEAKAR
jgi:hypothetical protein